MSTFLHVVLWVIIAAVTLWALIFGGIGVAIARLRGKTLWSGFGWGFCLGPIGWIVLLFAPSQQQRRGAIRGDITQSPARADVGAPDVRVLASDEDPDSLPDVL